MPHISMWDNKASLKKRRKGRRGEKGMKNEGAGDRSWGPGLFWMLSESTKEFRPRLSKAPVLCLELQIQAEGKGAGDGLRDGGPGGL